MLRPLIGDSHRGAAAVILVLGVGACAAGARRVTSTLFSVLGGTSFVLGVLAIITGSLTPLSLLVADMVVMSAIAMCDVPMPLRGGKSPRDKRDA